MDKAEEKLVKDLKKDLMKDKIISIIFKYRKHILLVCAVIVFLGVANAGYQYYIGVKANKNSIVFSDIKDKIVDSNNEEALAMLDQLIKDGTKGYKFISYMEKSAIYLRSNMIEESIATLQEAQKEVKLASYYKEMIQTIEYMIRSDNEKDLELITNEIKANLNKKSNFYYLKLEIYASLLVRQEKYQEAMDAYDEIINAEGVLPNLRDRSKRIRGMLYAYI